MAESKTTMSGWDHLYKVDKAALDAVKAAKPWYAGDGATNPKYFKTCYVSAAAAVKMLEHALRGVEKGMSSANRMPVEVMGMLIGRPSTDPKNPHAMVVTDAFPLPVEGIETRVEANADAQIAMVELSESIEVTREERIMGWYHSHPFDVQENPMYFFSSTDCQNQVVWQRGEDKHGNPFVGIVIDPLRSLAKGRPEMGSFRAFLPSYSQPTPMSPDGIPVTSANKSEIMERWGATWNRYYLMDTQYFMSDLTKRMVDILAKNFTWISVLSVSLKNDVEYKQQLAHRIGTIAATIGGSGNGGKGKTGGGEASAGLPRNELDNANSKAKELGMEQRVGSYTQDIKEGVFAKP